MAQVTGLKSRVFKGISWLAFSRALAQIFTFVSTIILARLLSPSDFGLIGIALVVENFMETLNKSGIITAIIQRKEMNNAVLSTVFWPNIGIGFLLFGLTALISGNVADFFGAPQAQPLIAVLAFSMVLDSFGIVQGGVLRREMKFRSVGMREAFSALGYGVVAVSCALLGLGVWSLVAGALARSLITAVVFWFAVSWRPSFEFYWKYFKEVYSFGFKVLLNGIVEFFRGNSDYALVGKILGTYNLGIYTLSYNVATLAQSRITTIVSSALPPAYSRIQDDFDRLQDAASRAAQYLALVVFPASFGLAVVAPEFIRVVYGAKWEEAILPAQILLVGGALLAINPIIEKVITAVGKPGVFAVLNAIRTIFLMGAIYTGLQLGGIVGVAWAVTISVVIYTPITHALAFRYIKGNVWKLWKGLGAIALISAFMALGVWGFRPVFSDLVASRAALLVLEVLLGVVLYAALIFIFKPPAFKGILDLALPILRERLWKISIFKPGARVK